MLSLCPLNYGCHRHHRLFFLQHRQSQQISHFAEITTKCGLIKTHSTSHTHTHGCTPRAALGSTDRCAVQPLGRSPARLDNFLAPHRKNERRQAQKRKSPSEILHTTVINGPRTIRGCARQLFHLVAILTAKVLLIGLLIGSSRTSG